MVSKFRNISKLKPLQYRWCALLYDYGDRQRLARGIFSWLKKYKLFFGLFVAFANIYVARLPCTPTEMSSTSSLNKLNQLNTTQRSNLQPKYYSVSGATFLDSTAYKNERFNGESVLDKRTLFKPKETFQYMFYTTCHPPLPFEPLFTVVETRFHKLRGFR